MIKFGGFDKDGQALHIACVTHHYSDLPMKGLGKSMESVGINEPVIIPQSAALKGVIWGYTEAEIERRAYELKAEVKWMGLPPQNPADERKFQMWFSNGEWRFTNKLNTKMNKKQEASNNSKTTIGYIR